MTDTVTEETDSPLLPGTAATKYYYRIRALTAGADTGGPWSADDDSTTGAASATTHGDVAGCTDSAITAVANQGDDARRLVNLEWTAPTDIGGSDITGYSVQRWNSDTSDSGTKCATPTHVSDEDVYTSDDDVERRSYARRNLLLQGSRREQPRVLARTPTTMTQADSRRHTGRARTDGDRHWTVRNRAHLEHSGRQWHDHHHGFLTRRSGETQHRWR